MNHQFFVTGIGTGIGKTLIAAILARALDADYWKPVQAGTDNTDSQVMLDLLPGLHIHPEVYKLSMAASPHIAARKERINISLENIVQRKPPGNRNLIIEGPGGLLVPLNDNEFVANLIEALGVKVILVSRNYLGSINHSLLTADSCKARKLPVTGWIFNDQYLHYEDEIVRWTGYPRIASIPFFKPSRLFVEEQAMIVREQLVAYL